MTEQNFSLRVAQWPQDQNALRLVREQVFVEEQQVPLELEWDGLDDQCVHLLAEDPSSQPIGTGRLLPDGHIGRMAVLRPWRRRGVGTALLQALITQAAQQGFSEVRLNAQVAAIPFYTAAGFETIGQVFDEAGIPHREMRLRLTPMPSTD